MLGMATPKKYIFGKFDIYGISSKLSFLKYTIIEESKIRIKNKQNLIFILLLAVVRIAYQIVRKIIK